MPIMVSSLFANPSTQPLSARAESARPSFARPLRPTRPPPGGGLDLQGLDLQHAVVAVPANAVGPVAEGCVVDDPCKAALALVQEQLPPFTSFRAQSRRFVSRGKLGEGHSSVVLQVEDCAEDYFEDRHVALKMIPLAGAYTEEAYATAALLKRLSHEFIVPCHEFFE
eukprot:EG_transcript_37313